MLHRHLARQLLVHDREAEDAAPGLAAEIDVVVDGQVPGQGEVLVHDLDPDVLRIARGIEDDGPGIEDDLSLGGGMESRQDLHQGRLARPVVPDHSEHLARKEPEIDAVERGDRPEALGDSARFEQRRRPSAVRRVVHPFLPLR